MPEQTSVSIPRVIAIVGPTAVGKTRLAEDIAVAIHGEIVSADAMQVYRGMDIGTAKPAPDVRRAPYHCLDLVEPGEDFSAALYQATARDAIDDIIRRGRTPVVAGGTGLYVRAALDDMRFPSGDTASAIRMELEHEAETVGAVVLHERLRSLDPVSADLIHPNNVRRTIRALEMAHEGVSYAEQAAGFSRRDPFYPTLFIGLTMDRERLYRRIEDRVDQMIADGLIDEVRALINAGLRDAMTAQQAIGYKEFVPVIEGEREIPCAADEVKQSTRRYAKRQLSWFRSDPRVQWIDVTDMSPAEVTRTTLELIESRESIHQQLTSNA